MAAEAAYELFFTDWTFTAEDGRQKSGPRLKFWVYAAGPVYCELRLFLYSMVGADPKKFAVNKYVKANWLDLAALFGMVEATAALKPSRNAARFWGEEYTTDPFVREEFSISSQGLFALCAWAASRKHKKAERQRWKDLLHTLIETSRVDRSFMRDTLCVLLMDHRDDCEQASITQDRCHHGQLVYTTLSLKPFSVVEAWVQVMGLAQECAACRVACRRFSCWFADAFDARLHALSAPVSECQMLRKDRFQPANKRLRVDEDLRPAPPTQHHPRTCLAPNHPIIHVCAQHHPPLHT